MNIEEYTAREECLSKTYEVSLIVGNMSPNQLDALKNFLDAFELNGAEVKKIKIQND